MYKYTCIEFKENSLSDQKYDKHRFLSIAFFINFNCMLLNFEMLITLQLGSLMHKTQLSFVCFILIGTHPLNLIGSVTTVIHMFLGIYSTKQLH